MYTKALFSILGLTAAIVPTMPTINAVDAIKDHQLEREAAKKLRVAVVERTRSAETEAASREAEAYSTQVSEAYIVAEISVSRATYRASVAYRAAELLAFEAEAYRASVAYRAAQRAVWRASISAAKAEAEYKEAELSLHVLPDISKIISSYI